MELVQSSKFNQVVSKLLVRLAETFPVAVNLDASAVGFEVIGGYETVESHGGLGEQIEVPASEDEVFFGQCVHWLIDEGYVRVSKSWAVQFSGAVLTKKALELTGLEPMVLKHGAY